METNRLAQGTLQFLDASDKDDAITDVELQQWENDLTGDEKITSDEKIRSLCSLINRDIPSNRLTDPAWRSPAKKTSESKLQREWDGKVNTNLISIRECNECEEEKTVEPCKNAEKIVLQARGVVEFSWLKQNITATPPELVPEDVEVFVGRTIIHQIPPDKGELKNESRIPPNGSRTNKHDYVAAPSVSPPADNKVFVAAPSVSPPANNYAFVKVPPMLPPIFHTQLASRIRNPSAIMPYFCPLLANTMPIYWNVFNNGMRFIAGTSSLVFGQWASRQLILNQIYRQKHEQAAAAAAAYRQAGVPTVDGAPNVAAATNNGKNVKSPEKKIYKKG